MFGWSVPDEEYKTAKKRANERESTVPSQLLTMDQEKLKKAQTKRSLDSDAGDRSLKDAFVNLDTIKEMVSYMHGLDEEMKVREQMDKRFEKVEKKMDEMEARVDKRLAKIESEMNEKMDKILKHLDALTAKIQESKQSNV